MCVYVCVCVHLQVLLPRALTDLVGLATLARVSGSWHSPWLAATQRLPFLHCMVLYHPSIHSLQPFIHSFIHSFFLSSQPCSPPWSHVDQAMKNKLLGVSLKGEAAWGTSGRSVGVTWEGSPYNGRLSASVSVAASNTS